MSSENLETGSQENKAVLAGDDSEASISQIQPPQRTSTELVIDTGLALGTGLGAGIIMASALVLDPDSFNDNFAPSQGEQYSPERQARIREAAEPSDSTADREVDAFPEGTSTVTADVNLAGRRGHGRAGAGRDMPLPPLPEPVALPEWMEGGQHIGRPRSMYSPLSPAGRNPPRQTSHSPLSRSHDAAPFVSPVFTETHAYAAGAGAPRAQQDRSRNDSAPRPRLQSQDTYIIDQPLPQNDPSRVGLVASGNGFAEDNVNDISLREHTRDLDHDPEGQHRGGIRQGKRRTADSERPQSIVFREDNMQRRTPGADNAGVLGAQNAEGILYSITPVDNSRPPHRQSASTRDEMDDGVRQNRTSGTRLSRTSRTHIDDLVPVITYAGSIKDRIDATLHDAESERIKYARKATYTAWALNIAIGLQVLLGALTTGLSAVATRGKSSAVATTILGALATLVASYLARARGSNEPELSVARVKDLEQFIRECKNFEKDFGDDTSNKYQPVVNRFRERFEGILGNTNDEQQLSTSGRISQRDTGSFHYS